MKKKILLVGILLLLIVGLVGCTEYDLKQKESVSLYEGQTIEVLNLRMTLIDANSGYWGRDCTATIFIENLDSNTNSTVVLNRTNEGYRQTTLGYIFELKQTSHKGATIIIY